MSPLLAAFILISICLICETNAYNILVTALSISYGEWNQILHVSKEILSRNEHFITFVIAENRRNWLNTIHEYNFNKSSYQILFTPSETKLTGDQVRNVDGINEKQILLLNHAFDLSFNAANQLIDILSTTNLHSQNTSLTVHHDDISLPKIDVCFMGQLHLMGYHVCNAFDIPIIIRAETSLLAHLEYNSFAPNSWLYYLNPWTFQSYADLKYGTIMSYSQRWKNIFLRFMDFIFQKEFSKSAITPKITKLNERLDFINFDHGQKYKDIHTMMDLWNKVGMISSLGTPYSTMFYSRPRIRQYGFLIYPEKPLSDTEEDELITWINTDDSPVIYIAMGSYHTLPNEILSVIYSTLLNHSKENGYRIIWALRQNITANGNHQLETDKFKIRHWVNQLEILKHPKTEIFLTHCGGNSVVEGLYTKTKMILYPQTDDQFFNAKRMEEVDAGLRIKDLEQLTDMIDIIDVLLLNEEIAEYYTDEINKLHKMLMRNGGVSEAADFIEYAAEFGIKHLFCTLGHKYDCVNDIEYKLQWYQTSMIDVWIILIIIVMVIYTVCLELYRWCNCVKYAVDTKYKIH